MRTIEFGEILAERQMPRSKHYVPWNAGLADPKIKERFAELAAVVLPSSPADFAKLIADETDKWGTVVKFARLKPD